MIKPFKHNIYNDWKLTNVWGKPVLCGSKIYYTNDYKFPVCRIIDKISVYIRSQFGKKNVIDYAFSPVESYKGLKNYKPKSLMFVLDIVFKVETNNHKEMFKNYRYVFDEIDKILNKYEKEE